MPNYKARPTSHTYFSHRLKLHYLDWGNSDAEHVLLIHGSQDNCHNWDWTSEILCQHYHVVVPDLRGHGDSEWNTGSPYNNLDYVYDIAQLIEQENLENVHIIAHSMGGTIACLYAGIYPEKVKSLTSIEGVGTFWYQREAEHPQKRIREWIDGTRILAGRMPRKYASQSDALQRMQKSNPHLSEERARHLTAHGSNRNEDGTYTWKFDNYTHSRTPFGMNKADINQLWQQITCPTLLLNAKQGFEHRTGQDDSMQFFRHGRLKELDNAGHWLHHDQFEEYIEIVTAFLKESAA